MVAVTRVVAMQSMHKLNDLHGSFCCFWFGDVCVDNGERQHNMGWKCIACKAFNIAGGLSCESCNLLCLICICCWHIIGYLFVDADVLRVIVVVVVVVVDGG